MLPFLKNLFKLGGRSAAPGDQDPQARTEKLKAILLAEMNRDTIEGKQVSHRRLESLILVTGAGRKETIRQLRAIGARPSRRHGSKIWTMKPAD